MKKPEAGELILTQRRTFGADVDYAINLRHEHRSIAGEGEPAWLSKRQQALRRSTIDPHSRADCSLHQETFCARTLLDAADATALNGLDQTLSTDQLILTLDHEKCRQR